MKQSTINVSSFKLYLVLSLLLVVVSIAGLLVGFVNLPVGDTISALFGTSDDEKIRLIVQEIRLPRLLMGLLIGASLGMAGAALQGLLRNPLADPGVIGISSSAGLGAVIAIYYGFAASNYLSVPAFAMTGALSAIVILYALSRRDSSVLTLILVGVGINALAGALISLSMNLAPNPFSLADMVLWLLGSLANRSYTDISLSLPFIAVGIVLLLLSARSLRALSLGEDVAATLGVNLLRTRSLVVVGAALAVGASVSVAGAIGFIGLVTPHLIRPFVNYDPARLMVPSAMVGAILITFADIMVRLMPTDREMKIGVLTALIGTPFFLYLVVKTRRQTR